MAVFLPRVSQPTRLVRLMTVKKVTVKGLDREGISVTKRKGCATPLISNKVIESI